MLYQLGVYAINDIPIEKMQGIDFFVFYKISEFISQGLAAQVTIPDELHKLLQSQGYEGTWHWLYPPTFMFVIGWMYIFPFFVSLSLFIVAQLALFFFACRNYLARDKWELLALMGIPCLSITLGWGQISILIASFIILGFRNLEKNPWLAGVFFGIAAVKPTMLLFLPIMLLVQRKYTTILSTALTVAILFGLSVLVYGTQVWINYFTISIPSLGFYLSELREVHYKMPTIFASLLMMGFDNQVLKIVECIVLLAGVAAVFLFCRKGKSELWQITVLGLITMLTLPYAYSYDFLIVIPFFMAWFFRSFEYLNLRLLLIFLCGYLLDVITLAVNHTLPAMPLILIGLIVFIYHTNRQESYKQLAST